MVARAGLGPSAMLYRRMRFVAEPLSFKTAIGIGMKTALELSSSGGLSF
jgi:hypothetical protein